LDLVFALRISKMDHSDPMAASSRLTADTEAFLSGEYAIVSVYGAMQFRLGLS
jgi:hypothetical protein